MVDSLQKFTNALSIPTILSLTPTMYHLGTVHMLQMTDRQMDRQHIVPYAQPLVWPTKKHTTANNYHLICIDISQLLQLQCTLIVIWKVNVRNLSSVSDGLVTNQRPDATEYTDVTLEANHQQ